VLTLLDAISLAGDRDKQNDDACGIAGQCAWVIDGATDLHDAPIADAATDAAWIAAGLNQVFNSRRFDGPQNEASLRNALADASAALAERFAPHARARGTFPAWMSPIASLIIAAETDAGLVTLDLGDCRLYARDADGAAQTAGGPEDAADRETRFAAEAAKSAPGETAALYRTPHVLEILRAKRAAQNSDAGSAIFGLDPRCAKQARFAALSLKRPAHSLICTDGFSALCDRYGAYDAAGFVAAALERGLHELGRELRAIETADAGGAKHPRWKRSDDATALLLRLS
jgi:hypothetical protein